MIKEVKSTVFNVEADVIVNTVNCVGVMGAGLALEFALRYPEMEKEYIELCKKKQIIIGKVTLFKAKDIHIINFPTKYHFKNPSKIDWIESGLIDFCAKYNQGIFKGRKIAFPYLGCANGELNRQEVKKVMYKYLEDLNLEVILCSSTAEAEGKEKEMLDSIKNSNIEEIKIRFGLNIKQYTSLNDNIMNLKHFYELCDLPSIGKITYRKIFTYYYFNSKSDNQQLAFDFCE